MTAVFTGAPIDFQSGNRSSSAVGSKTLPDRMCAPISEPFSTTTMPSVVVQLHQPTRRGQSGRSAADDDDVEFHGFAFAASLIALLSFSGTRSCICGDEHLLR